MMATVLRKAADRLQRFLSSSRDPASAGRCSSQESRKLFKKRLRQVEAASGDPQGGEAGVTQGAGGDFSKLET